MNKHIITRLDPGADHQGAVARGRRYKQTGRLLEAPSLWNGEEGDFLGHSLGGKGALGCAKHARTDRKLGLCHTGRG